MLFVSSSHIRSSSFFARISGSESGSLVSSSFDFTVHKVFGSFILDDNNNISLKIPSQSSGANSDLSALIVTSSNGRLRVGVGTTNPKSVFDFKDIEDSSIGAELLVRSARSTRGALTGDEGGSINFIIDSGSFNDIKTSGSLAKIKTNVNSVGNTGVQGKLVFELSKGASDFQDAFSYGFSQISDTDFNLFSQIQTASLLLRDFSAGGKSVIEMRDNSDNTKLKLANGNITFSEQVHHRVNGSSYIRLRDSAQDIVRINEGGADIDFEVNGDNYDNLFKTDAADNFVEVSGSLRITGVGDITASGNISASNQITGKTLNINGTGTTNIHNDTINLGVDSGDRINAHAFFTTRLHTTSHITASGNVSASNTSTASFGSMLLSNLPTTKPTVTGSLWLSGSAGNDSKYLVVFTG